MAHHCHPLTARSLGYELRSSSPMVYVGSTKVTVLSLVISVNLVVFFYGTAVPTVARTRSLSLSMQSPPLMAILMQIEKDKLTA
eukprot:scaffold2123_cov63-Attheya_sp.AAC.2